MIKTILKFAYLYLRYCIGFYVFMLVILTCIIHDIFFVFPYVFNFISKKIKKTYLFKVIDNKIRIYRFKCMMKKMKSFTFDLVADPGFNSATL